MKVFDKAQWHIDGGENETTVIDKFKEVFSFLNKNGMLSADGVEVLDVGIDSSVSLNERMLTPAGCAFIETCYDDVINCDADVMHTQLEASFTQFRFRTQ